MGAELVGEEIAVDVEIDADPEHGEGQAGPSALLSIRMPEVLRRRISTSFGHLISTRDSSPRKSATVSATATAAPRISVGASAIDPVGRSSNDV
ncbi:MAG: hypothetical protein R3E53_14110 [Myxococcota bacterium]